MNIKQNCSLLCSSLWLEVDMTVQHKVQLQDESVLSSVTLGSH